MSSSGVSPGISCWQITEYFFKSQKNVPSFCEICQTFCTAKDSLQNFTGKYFLFTKIVYICNFVYTSLLQLECLAVLQWKRVCIVDVFTCEHGAIIAVPASLLLWHHYNYMCVWSFLAWWNYSRQSGHYSFFFLAANYVICKRTLKWIPFGANRHIKVCVTASFRRNLLVACWAAFQTEHLICKD